MMFTDIDHLIMILAAIFLILVLIIVIWLVCRRKSKPLPMDEMEGHDFEYKLIYAVEGIGYPIHRITHILHCHAHVYRIIL